MQKGEEAVGLPPEKDFSDKMVVLLLYYSAASFSLVPLNHRTCVQAQMIKVEREEAYRIHSLLVHYI